MEKTKKRTSMSVPEMGKMLGLGKTESYYLVKKNYFKVITVGTKMRVMIDSFEEWYGNQSWYRKADGTPPGEIIKQHTLSAEELGELLGLSEAYAYELIGRDYFEEVAVLGKKRITKESFERWYKSQSFYRTQEDREKLNDQMEVTYSMPEIARMLGLHRNSIYSLVEKGVFDIVKVGNQKRVTRDSFFRWYNGQNHYKIKADANKMKGRD